ncbi:MAG: Asp-tRNA(Asn)/Glu-tRNA(Gln) amidotransferase subunit GatC [bacterium]
MDINIDHLCELAHIHLNPQEKEIITKDIQKIIEFFTKIQSINLEFEDYYYHDHLKETKYLEQTHPPINFEEFLEQNSVREQNYFKIPPILKRE